MLLNEDMEVMKQAFSRIMLFLTFVKVPTSKNGLAHKLHGWGDESKEELEELTNIYTTL